MQIQWHKLYNIFFFALAMVMAGIFSLEPAAEAQTTTKDDVQSTVVPGQVAPRLQNLGDHRFPVTTSSARAVIHQSGHDADLWV